MRENRMNRAWSTIVAARFPGTTVLRYGLQRLGALSLSVVMASGCATTSLTPMIRAVDTLTRPDRVLVYDFAVTPNSLETNYALDPQAAGGKGSQAQTEEDIQVGKVFAKALTQSLVEELRNRGIDAYRASAAAPPGENTASIKGRFLRTSQKDRSTLVGFGLGGSQIRIDVQFYQGTGANLRLVARDEIDTPSNLKSELSGPTAAASGRAGGTAAIVNPAVLATVETDAQRAAQAVAERVAGYYRQRRWSQS
jgi:hypothetical protein